MSSLLAPCFSPLAVLPRYVFEIECVTPLDTQLACRMAIANGDFQAMTTSEIGDELVGPHVTKCLADACDSPLGHLDHSVDLRVQLILAEVANQIPERIDVQHVQTKAADDSFGLGQIKTDQVTDRLAQFFQRRTGGYVCGDGSKDITSVKGGADGRLVVRNMGQPHRP